VKNTYYFSHDTNANQDPKILAMRSVYGWEGYGWYWLIIEMMREQQDYQLNIEGKYAWNAFALQMQCADEQAQKYIMDCINEFHLFESDGKNFWSNSLLRRMERADEKSNKARESALLRWEKERNANAEQTQCAPNAIKEKKVKEKKSINYSLEIEKFRSRYSPEQLETIEQYLEILRTTRVSGKLAPSVEHGVYEDMHRYDPLIVEHACKKVISKPELHAKKENYFAGILRNTTVDEALKGLLPSRASPQHRVNGTMFGADAEVV